MKNLLSKCSAVRLVLHLHFQLPGQFWIKNLFYRSCQVGMAPLLRRRNDYKQGEGRLP
jgi:hypothetical protein